MNDEINTKGKFINDFNTNIKINKKDDIFISYISDTEKNNDLNKNTKKKIKYIVTIIGDNYIKNIFLNDYDSHKITFGRSEDNDIVLPSLLVSQHHGYFTIDDGSIRVFDENSKNGIFVNSVKAKDSYLNDGDFIKIDNPNNPLSMGILMVITIGEKENKWISFPLRDKKNVLIGRGEDCDIVFNRISVLLKHAKITSLDKGHYISAYNNKGSIILNNSILIGQKLLKDKDVIIINNIKLIYNKNSILYQLYDEGVRLDATDIVKTIKVKGKKKDIAQHINFSATPGQFIAFIGGSGAGKSTFLKCISGISKPTSGKVLVNGSDLFNNYSALKNLIGYVPQENIIFNDLTLIDMLKYSANLRMPDDVTYQEKINRINNVLDIVELSDKKDVMIRNLSGGQKKRACIAVELIADPKLFFLDEPTSGLDPGTERSIMKTLRKMADSGKTIILVTHNTLNLNLCDKVVFFGYGGKLCFDGKPDDALEFFKVKDFVDIYNLISNAPDKWLNDFNESKYNNKNNIDEFNTNNKNIENEITNINKKKNSKSFFRQLHTLFIRRLKILINNHQQLVLLFAQVPLIAFLLSIVVTKNIFYSYEETKAILFSLVTAAIWLGLLNAIQEVCKERVILEKEYMSDLRISSYLCSKLLFLFLLSIIQSFLLISAFVLFVDVPSSGVIFSWYIETVFIIILTIFSASSMGLFVSILAKDSSSASTMPTLLLVPQLLFSGILFPLDGVIGKISNFILCRWSTEALGTINDLNSLISSIQEVFPGYIREVESYYSFTINHLLYDGTIIIIMTFTFIIISFIILKRQLESGRY